MATAATATAALAADARRLAALERELTVALDKLLRVDASMESALTCLGCAALLVNPLQCLPCMHPHCADCAERARGAVDGPACEECGGQATDFVPCERLDTLSGKFGFRQQALAALKDALGKGRENRETVSRQVLET
jgi:hypothetical protein